jgi:hypothetical protein
MADERNDAQRETPDGEYEAPAVEGLGPTAKATGGDQNFSLQDNDPSDGRLKERVEPLETALERLLSIRTR